MTPARLPAHATSLREVIGEHEVVAFSIGPSGESWLVLALETLDYRSGNNLFAKTRHDAPQRYRVLSVRDGQVEVDLTIEGEPFNIHLVQPFAGGLLLACARCCRRGPDDVDLNGRLYAMDGTFKQALLLGDGIESLHATRRGALWASYFDEGVFGNYGWDVPVGASGLVSWSAQGEKQYEFDAVGAPGSISDCYALNVATDDDVWCCYYTDFPLVHLRGGRVVSVWPNPVAGSHAFAVGAGHALFAGSHEAHHEFHLVQLGANGTGRLVRSFELHDDEGERVRADRVDGRGSALHVLAGGVLHTVELSEVLRSHRR